MFAPKIRCRLKIQSIWHTLQVCTFKNKNSTPKKLKNWINFLHTFCIFCIIWLFYVWRTSKNIITLFLELWQKFWYVTSIVLKKFFWVDFSTWTCFKPKPLHGIWPKYRTHGFVHWFYNLENTIPIHVHAYTILENPFPINVHEYYILENPIHINVRTSLQTKITVKLNIKIWKYLLQKCVFCANKKE